MPASARLGEVPELALSPTLPAGRYGEMVAAAKEYIAAGDIFQVVLAQRFTTPFPLEPFELYRALRRRAVGTHATILAVRKARSK